MKTAEQAAPPFPPDHFDVAEGKRRRRWPMLAALILVMILLTGGIAFWWISSEFVPVRANTSAASRVRVEDGQIIRVPARDAAARSGDHFVAFLAPYRDGKWLDMGFTLWNDAAFPVSIDQIGLAGSSSPLRLVSVSIESKQRPDQVIPFQPFAIPGHDGRFVVVRYRFSGCSLDPNAEDPVIYSTQFVRYRMRLGWLTIHRAEVMPLAYSIAVTGNEGCG